MDYQNTDEAIRREACEQVKKIAEAIIKIRKKYYLCFSKISAIDQKRYDDLKNQMQSIANQNGLQKLNIQLMSDIDTQFGEEKPNFTDENGQPSDEQIEGLYQKFITAAKMQAELTVLFSKVVNSDPKLAAAYMKKATMCQDFEKECKKILIEKISEFRLSCDKLAVLADKFREQSKGYVDKLFGGIGYKKTASQDPLNFEDMICAIKEIKEKEKIAPNLETGRI